MKTTSALLVGLLVASLSVLAIQPVRADTTPNCVEGAWTSWTRVYDVPNGTPGWSVPVQWFVDDSGVGYVQMSNDSVYLISPSGTVSKPEPSTTSVGLAGRLASGLGTYVVVGQSSSDKIFSAGVLIASLTPKTTGIPQMSPSGQYVLMVNMTSNGGAALFQATGTDPLSCGSSVTTTINSTIGGGGGSLAPLNCEPGLGYVCESTNSTGLSGVNSTQSSPPSSGPINPTLTLPADSGLIAAGIIVITAAIGGPALYFQLKKGKTGQSRRKGGSNKLFA